MIRSKFDVAENQFLRKSGGVKDLKIEDVFRGKKSKLRGVTARRWEEIFKKSPKWFYNRKVRLKQLVSLIRKFPKHRHRGKWIDEAKQLRPLLKRYDTWSRKLARERNVRRKEKFKPTTSAWLLYNWLKRAENLDRKLNGRQKACYSPEQRAEFRAALKIVKARISNTLKSDWFRRQNPLDFPVDLQAILKRCQL